MKKDLSNQGTRKVIQDKINGQNINKSYVILYLLVFAIVVVGEVILAWFNDFDLAALFQDIIGNLMGVLAAFLIFDIIHEKISRDSYASQMSQQILETLMANPEALDLFTEEQRKNFIEATINSIADDDDATEMINNHVVEYLVKNKDYRIRPRFDYKFEISAALPKVFDVFSNTEDYYYVQEIFGYDIKYLTPKANNTKDKIVSIGFTFDNISLDGALRDRSKDTEFQNCIFKESLDLKQEDIKYLKQLTQEELKRKFSELFKVDLQIDKCPGRLEEVIFKDSGLIAKYEVNHNLQADRHSVRIIFHMPKRWGSVLEVAIVDPTKAPKITVSYPEDIMEVEMFSFLSKGEESSLEVSHQHANGIYDIALNTEWVYPISGIVFTINKKSYASD